jgi:dihydroorotate dehydrogenase (NAD+) catalytic subunit
VLLSGCVGFGEEYTRVAGFSNRDVGAICLKGTTGKARLGNKPHRVFETPMGMLNAIGLQNPGVDVVVREILPTLDFSETRFIANASGSTIEEYIEVVSKFDDSPIDAIEINISCPNVKEGGVQFGNSPEMSARVVEACRKVTKKPLITKLSPNQTDIQLNARLCIEAGTNGLAVINTMMGMAIDTRTGKPVIGNRQGGLSGPAIKPIALLKTGAGGGSGAPAWRARSSARAASCARTTPSSSCWPAPRPWAWAPRCSTTRWYARRSTPASPNTSTGTGLDSCPIWSAVSPRLRLQWGACS